MRPNASSIERLVDIAYATTSDVGREPLLVKAPIVIDRLEADCSKPMPPDYVTKRVAILKEHLGVADKRAETVALEDEALRLYRETPGPRPSGKTGPEPKGGLSFREIGGRLDRSERWAALAVQAAVRREQAVAVLPSERFDASIIALRKFTSSELLDAGFNVSMVAQRQGHGPHDGAPSPTR